MHHCYDGGNSSSNHSTELPVHVHSSDLDPSLVPHSSAHDCRRELHADRHWQKRYLREMFLRKVELDTLRRRSCRLLLQALRKRVGSTIEHYHDSHQYKYTWGGREDVPPTFVTSALSRPGRYAPVSIELRTLSKIALKSGRPNWVRDRRFVRASYSLPASTATGGQCRGTTRR